MQELSGQISENIVGHYSEAYSEQRIVRYPDTSSQTSVRS